MPVAPRTGLVFRGEAMRSEQIELLIHRLDRIEAALATLVQQKAVKDWYSTHEVAELVGKAEYTVREWCRQGRVQARKASNGRGWLISYQELLRIRNEGPLPLKDEVHR